MEKLALLNRGCTIGHGHTMVEAMWLNTAQQFATAFERRCMDHGGCHQPRCITTMCSPQVIPAERAMPIKRPSWS